MVLTGYISITLSNGKVVTARWDYTYPMVRITCYDIDYGGSYSIESDAIMAEVDAKWCLKQLVLINGGEPI